MAKKPDAKSYAGQNKLNAIMAQGRKPKKSAIPGGGTGPNSAYKFKTDAGYETGEAAQAAGTGTSIFDPVLCEVLYKWFSPPGGQILDPFAGGSVRGIVASVLGYDYTGIDLRAEQIEANREQGAEICPERQPQWICGDSQNIRTLAAGVKADLVFSCPPYADLERYSDDPADLSTMDYADFLTAYRKIIAESCAMLKPDRFAVFVVGEARDKDGAYYGFVPDTIRAFQDAGMVLYNEIILLTAIGSLPIRAGKQFQASRKVGKTHQNVLVFLKGDPFKAAKACGIIEVVEPEVEKESSEVDPLDWGRVDGV